MVEDQRTPNNNEMRPEYFEFARSMLLKFVLLYG